MRIQDSRGRIEVKNVCRAIGLFPYNNYFWDQPLHGAKERSGPVNGLILMRLYFVLELHFTEITEPSSIHVNIIPSYASVYNYILSLLSPALCLGSDIYPPITVCGNFHMANLCSSRSPSHKVRELSRLIRLQLVIVPGFGP